MSSTEQKNVTQPFIDCAYTYGILPTILTGAFDDFPLCTADMPFDNLHPTSNLGQRLRAASDPVREARLLLPTLRNASVITRVSPLLLRLCHDSRVFSGNQAVMRFCNNLLLRRWGIHTLETKAIRHAKLHTAKVSSLLASGSYSDYARTIDNTNSIKFSDDSAFYRSTADLIEFISKTSGPRSHKRLIRSWCAEARPYSGFEVSYRTTKDAITAFRNFSADALASTELPTPLKQKWFSTKNSSTIKLEVYTYGSQTIIRIKNKYSKCTSSSLIQTPGESAKSPRPIISEYRQPHEVYFFNKRDFADLTFLLQASAQTQIYMKRRLEDVDNKKERSRLELIQKEVWSHYVSVMRHCGNYWKCRNKLGVYFDVLAWRYMAWKSGDAFYNHSNIMRNKVETKGLSTMPDQSHILNRIKTLPMDAAVDLLGIYKASIYPEVDPFEVVCSQYKLHMNRHVTDWPKDSEERRRFEDTKSYMWYFATRTIQQQIGIWPGRIREGVPVKTWHKNYKNHGIPTTNWRDGFDVDLTGAVPVTDITAEQYIRQQDSACAPPLAQEYKDFESLQKAPRRHRRKLLYAIQEPDPPDLQLTLEYLNGLGLTIPDEYVGEIEYDLPFSTDIVTGSRCERHKDTPRPFYAASPPWGCILSYFDGITRDFLNTVPQSMLGKSTKQKNTDLITTSRPDYTGARCFFMSDDKAKYSPHMDPQSQQLPAEFFAELFNIPAFRAYGPIMYHCKLYYRVCGHLVSYGSNGTDREGMRGASNTWLEIIAQGLSTRLSREKGLIRGKSVFLSFIDDGLRRFHVEHRGKSEEEVMDNAKLVIEDVIFGLKVLGRELSWDKTFISTKLFVMLNEIIYDGMHFSSGLKSFCTAGDIEMKEVMTASDYEQLYFGKMRGSHGVGVPLDLCHYVYVFETLRSHYAMGVNLQDNRWMSEFDYRLFCITPMALGGAGVRTMLQMGCNEVANATKEGMATLVRLAVARPLYGMVVQKIIEQPLEPVKPLDFMREPEQFHVEPPRIRTQRLAAEVRNGLARIVGNERSRGYLVRDRVGCEFLESLGRILMQLGDVSAEEVRLLYACTPVAFVDEFVQKLASSTTLSELIGREAITRIRRLCRSDIIRSSRSFAARCESMQLIALVKSTPELRMSFPEVLR